MSQVVSMVRGMVEPGRLDEVLLPYQAALAEGLPAAIVDTYLGRTVDGSVVILTVWRDRSDLEAMRASDEEPFARKLIREAGGEPTAEFLDVLASTTAGLSG